MVATCSIPAAMAVAAAMGARMVPTRGTLTADE